MPLSRNYEREIADLENHMATLDEHLDLLAALARNTTNERARARLAARIAAVEATFAELKRRRAAIQARLNGKGPAD